MTTLCAKLRKEKTVETVRAIVGPVSLFVGTESASTLRIARFADNTAGTLHRRICLPLWILPTPQLALCYFPYANRYSLSSLWSMITSQKKPPPSKFSTLFWPALIAAETCLTSLIPPTKTALSSPRNKRLVCSSNIWSETLLDSFGLLLCKVARQFLASMDSVLKTSSPGLWELPLNVIYGPSGPLPLYPLARPSVRRY